MKWRQDLNETHDLGDRVHYRVFAEGEGLVLSLDDETCMNLNCEKEGIKGFDVIVLKGNKTLQDFWIKEWGCLAILNLITK